MKTASMHFRLSEELKAGLQAAAIEDGRTTSNLIEVVLRDWLRARQKAKASAPVNDLETGEAPKIAVA